MAKREFGQPLTRIMTLDPSEARRVIAAKLADPELAPAIRNTLLIYQRQLGVNNQMTDNTLKIQQLVESLPKVPKGSQSYHNILDQLIRLGWSSQPLPVQADSVLAVIESVAEESPAKKATTKKRATKKQRVLKRPFRGKKKTN